MAKNHLVTTENTFIKKTTPMPVTCDCCGFELPEDAESNSGYFVNFLQCKDISRNNKLITGAPSQFLQKVKVENNLITAGSSSEGYHLKDNYDFVRWVVWCVRCHSDKSRLQDMKRKTNHMKPDGQMKSLSLKESIKRLNANQNMKRASRPS